VASPNASIAVNTINFFNFDPPLIGILLHLVFFHQ
jgi:hypothetical protein